MKYKLLSIKSSNYETFIWCEEVIPFWERILFRRRPRTHSIVGLAKYWERVQPCASREPIPKELVEWANKVVKEKGLEP